MGITRAEGVALAHASGWVVAQISVGKPDEHRLASEEPRLVKPSVVFETLDNDKWALGYAVGAFQGALQCALGVEDDDTKDFARTFFGFSHYLGIGNDAAAHLLNLNGLEALQQDPEYLEGNGAGGRELFNYVKNYALETLKTPQDWPASLFVHLAPDKCLSLHEEPSLVPDLSSHMTISLTAMTFTSFRLESEDQPEPKDETHTSQPTVQDFKDAAQETRFAKAAEDKEVQEAMKRLLSACGPLGVPLQRNLIWRYACIVAKSEAYVFELDDHFIQRRAEQIDYFVRRKRQYPELSKETITGVGHVGVGGTGCLGILVLGVVVGVAFRVLN